MSYPSVPFNFGALPPALSDLSTARALILPVPYDGTTSYIPGARFGPQAIIAASRQLELFDPDELRDFSRVGIATCAPLEPNLQGPEKMVEAIQTAWDELWSENRFLLMLGGEHSVTLGALRALATRFPALGVLQLDAHLDLRASYEGSPYNHACVMRRAREELGLPLTQVGIRSFSEEEHLYLKGEGLGFFPARTLTEASPAERGSLLDRIVDTLPPQVYLTCDLDVLDPSLLPATGTPEPGGLDWYTVVALIERVARTRTIVAADVVELAPIPGQIASDFTAAKLAYKIIGLATS